MPCLAYTALKLPRGPGREGYVCVVSKGANTILCFLGYDTVGSVACPPTPHSPRSPAVHRQKNPKSSVEGRDVAPRLWLTPPRCYSTIAQGKGRYGEKISTLPSSVARDPNIGSHVNSFCSPSCPVSMEKVRK